MRIIVPMAGMGKRMRPHTLTTPKPLVPVAGKPIVERLVEDISRLVKTPVQEVAYIIGRSFGAEAEAHLIEVAARQGAVGTIHYQDEALGTAHAILCARTALQGEVVVAFADTLFRAAFDMQPGLDGTIWVSRIDDPRQFGVVTLDDAGHINGFVEKPQEFVSDLAIIGIYHFASGENLMAELDYLLANNIMEKGEYQLTNALENMKNKGLRFGVGRVDAWLDCGNKNATLGANADVLDHLPHAERRHATATLTDTVIIEPCYIGAGVTVEASVIGPHVSLGAGATVRRSIVQHAIIGQQATLHGAHLQGAMVGNHAVVQGAAMAASISDYSRLDCKGC